MFVLKITERGFTSNCVFCSVIHCQRGGWGGFVGCSDQLFKMEWWVPIAVGVLVVILTTYILYKRESRRVKVKLENSDEAKEELLDDYRGRAVRRVQQLDELRKSPSKLKNAVKNYWKRKKDYDKVLAESKAEKGDGMRSLYKLPQNVQVPSQPLVRAGDSVKGKGRFNKNSSSADAESPAMGRLRELAIETLKRNFDFLNAEQLTALSYELSEVQIRSGDVLVAEGSKIETPSLQIVESGALECTCDGGR